MPSQSLPNLSSIHQQLAGHGNRIQDFMDAIPFQMDHLRTALESQNWPEVQRCCESLAEAGKMRAGGEDCELSDLRDAALAIQEAISTDNLLMAQRDLAKLVKRYGNAKPPTGKQPGNKLPQAEPDSQRRT